MAFGTIFRSNLAFTIRAHKQIGKSALFAAAEVVRSEAVKNAKRGMTSGKFVGKSANPLYQNIFKDVQMGNVSASSSPAQASRQGSFSDSGDTKGIAYIGTPIKHGAYWEEGHDNVFIGHYIRVPWLTHAFRKTSNKQQEKAKEAAERTARRFGVMGLERLAGLTPIGPLRSTIGR